ncbi:Tubulin-specific chaperone C [Termitomyces sp. J132]|nr:Tubulin-specific chaperone C [Termitomyces sp. J132]
MSDEAKWSFSQSFSVRFHSSRLDLEARINDAKSNTTISEELLQDLSIELARLVKSLADATGSIPRYDQRQYEEQVTALEIALSDVKRLSKQKPKFAFKRTAATSTPKNIPKPATAFPENLSTLPKSTTNLSLSGCSYQLLTWESLPKSSLPEDLAIQDLDHCIVNLIPSGRGSAPHSTLQISALHIQNLADTVLLLPPIEGSVLIHDLTRCTIVVGCHQYRMHTSKNVDVYLAVTSDPVIEHCSGVRFGGYPSILGSTAIVVSQPSKHHNVLDFSHIRSSPSPHWSTLDNDRVSSKWLSGNLAMTREVLDATRENMLPES